MDNSSSEEVVFTIREKFSAFSELKDKKLILRRQTLCNCALGVQDRYFLIERTSQSLLYQAL